MTTDRKTLFLAVVFAAAAGLSGCNTVRGIGQDVEAGGEAVQEGADEVQEELSN
jgi:entericidin B